MRSSTIRPAALLALLASLAIMSGACRTTGDPVRRDDPWGNLRANRLFELAEEYYAAGRYANAVVEYRSYLDLYGLNHRANDAAYRIAQSLEALGERTEAASIYRSTGMLYPQSELAPPAHLRAGELFELEGWLRDAEFDYKRAAGYSETEAGKTAAERLAALKERLAAAEAERSAARRSGQPLPPSSSDALLYHPFPPAGRSLSDVIQGR
jgi:tetratricopeptide (TPR) repeat protein